MIYTVTLNPAIDKTVVIENFTAGAVNRVGAVREDAGGKGINVSKCLKNLGAETEAVVVLAGNTGKRLGKMLDAMKIHMLRVDAEGENRTNLKIVDPVNGRNTDINEPGPKIDMQLLENLKEKLGKSVGKGDIVVLSGSLPAGVDKGLYGQWIRYLRSHGASVLLDADGEPLMRAIDALPYMIKPNGEELAALMGKERLTREEMISEGKRLHEMGIPEVVISLGAEGALFINADGCFHAKALQVPVKSTVGAGDSMVAAMVYGKQKKLSREEKLRLCVAMGAASVMQTGTQPPEASLVWELAKAVQIEKL